MLRFMSGLARGMAILGGIVLAVMILIVCLSIVGRITNGFLHSGFMMSALPGLSTWLLDLGIGPVNGDYELVEAGMAFCIFAFLPLAQISSGHATVDIFTNFLPMPAQRLLRALIEIVFGLVLVIIAWKLFEGMMSKKSSGGTTLLLQFPIWWAYACGLIGAVVSAIIGVYMAFVRIAEFLTGRVIVADGPEAEH